jgi:hypothetical protein
MRILLSLFSSICGAAGALLLVLVLASVAQNARADEPLTGGGCNCSGCPYGGDCYDNIPKCGYCLCVGYSCE